MERFARRLAVLLALGACAPEPPAEPPLPRPPPPPPVRPVRPAATPPRPPPAEATHGAAARGETAPAERTASPGEGAPVAPAGPVWRVRRDGTVGCADAEALRLLMRRAEVPPRLLAEARAAGGCRTTFRVNEWALAGQEGDLLRLRLLDGGALTLWFAREDLEGPP
jgi:hypothetical protein